MLRSTVRQGKAEQRSTGFDADRAVLMGIPPLNMDICTHYCFGGGDRFVLSMTHE